MAQNSPGATLQSTILKRSAESLLYTVITLSNILLELYAAAHCRLYSLG